MAEGAPLLREYTVMNRIVGSNPTLSAIYNRNLRFHLFKIVPTFVFEYDIWNWEI